jgi:hypothetical protein
MLTVLRIGGGVTSDNHEEVCQILADCLKQGRFPKLKKLRIVDGSWRRASVHKYIQRCGLEGVCLTLGVSLVVDNTKDKTLEA